ncbi:P-loop NTPase family protein [Lysinibacillus xylanilyticus]|uniref:hypothetical protein n=1 Tax=Lysinibacillus xylanilyticus TaxID=582475 RepID=UPI0036DED793
MLWFLAALCMTAFAYAFMFRPSRKLQTLHKYKTLEEMTSATAEYFRERTYPNTRNLVSNEQALAENSEKNMLMDTIELASAGSYPHRKLIIEEISTFLMSDAFGIDKLEDLSCISFINAKQMTPTEKFEVMMFYLQKELEDEMRKAGTYSDDSMGQFEAFYNFVELFGILDKSRQLRTNTDHVGIYVTEKDIDNYFDMFMSERDEDITVNDAISITSIFIYQNLFGFSVVDTLIYQSIDEIQIGVGGTEVGEKRHIASPLNSVYAIINNKKIRLQFLRFESITDLENTVISLSENGEETFTPKDGYKYTTLKNLRRVTSRREPVADYMSTNVRKLATSGPSNVDLLKKNPVEIYDAEFVGEWLQLLAWAKMCVIWSGGQGTGKSSHMNAFTELFGPDVAIRALGNIDESRFKDREPEFDIQHFFKTKDRGIHEVAGLMRRTNGGYMLLMEVITAEDAQEAINNFTSGYLGGALTTHASTPEDAIQFLGQLLAMGQNTSTNDTQDQCARVMSTFIGVQKNGDIFGFSGISEIVPRDWKPKFTEIDKSNPQVAQAENDKLYQENILNPEIFTTRRLVGFNREINRYYPDQAPSVRYLETLYRALEAKHREFMFGFMKKYYGIDAEQMLVDAGVIIYMKEGA